MYILHITIKGYDYKHTITLDVRKSSSKIIYVVCTFGIRYLHSKTIFMKLYLRKVRPFSLSYYSTRKLLWLLSPTLI